jgi:hypothetical protein
MMGLEPTTFCMACASDRARPFAAVRSNGLLAGLPVHASEHKRTRANAEPCHSCHGTQTPSSDVGPRNSCRLASQVALRPRAQRRSPHGQRFIVRSRCPGSRSRFREGVAYGHDPSRTRGSAGRSCLCTQAHPMMWTRRSDGAPCGRAAPATGTRRASPPCRGS